MLVLKVCVDYRMFQQFLIYSGKDSCSGDSGGPLMIKRHKRLDTHMTQIGVVSWGLDQCGNEGVPGIYTNVRYFLSWILDHLD